MTDKLDSDPLVDGLYAENVLSPRLSSILESHGWTKITNDFNLPDVHQFYRMFRLDN